MTQQLKLLAVLAHPDDESLGFGGTLARYGAEGVETTLLQPRGENGAALAHKGKTRTPWKSAAFVTPN